jgi:hypothetical protein
MKKIIILAILISPLSLFAQDVKKESLEPKTKMEVFVSKTGPITKFTDTNLPGLKTSYGMLTETRIRKISNGTASSYFYQIVKEGKYGSSTASIEYSDLIEVIKALKTLKAEVDKDIASKSDYLENKFITVDGFQVGYYVSKGKSTWYLKLEKYGSDNTVFVTSVEELETAFNEAKAKMDQIKS